MDADYFNQGRNQYKVSSFYNKMLEGEKINQAQIHALLFEEKLSWRSIIYDLINSEQLDPWNIDISLLSERYLAKIRELEEANFFVSSNVLLVASLLLRLKSEIVLNEDLPALDEILMGKKERKEDTQERIELDEDVPALVARTPLPRFRRVSLEELMAALGQAINTETRRIRKEILVKQVEREVATALPRRDFDLKRHIAAIYSNLLDIFEEREERIGFSQLFQGTRDEKINSFVSILHLDNQQRVWLEQDRHFEEIWIWVKEVYNRVHKERLDKIRLDVEAFMREAEKSQEASDIAMNSEEAAVAAADEAAEDKEESKKRVSFSEFKQASDEEAEE